jgi:hypothetical protein
VNYLGRSMAIGGVVGGMLLFAGCGSGSSVTSTTTTTSAAASATLSNSASTMTTTKGAEPASPNSTSGPRNSTPRQSSPAVKGALAQFAACIRKQGINLPEPNKAGGGPVFNTKGVNTKSVKFKAAELKCRSALLGAFHVHKGERRAHGFSTSTSTGTTSVPSTTPAATAGGPAVAQYVSFCKAFIRREPRLLANVKSKVEGICAKAPHGDLAEARAAAKEVCVEVTNAAPLPAATKAKTLLTCKVL